MSRPNGVVKKKLDCAKEEPKKRPCMAEELMNISWFTVLSWKPVRPQHINTILADDEMVILSNLEKGARE